MLTNSSYTRRGSAHLRSLQNHWWLVLFAILILLLMAKQASTAQTSKHRPVVVTGEAVATPTPHDNWHEMRQHIMPEVSGTKITVTKKATVIKLDQQPPVEDNDLQELFTQGAGVPDYASSTRRGNSTSPTVDSVIRRNQSLPLCSGTVCHS